MKIKSMKRTIPALLTLAVAVVLLVAAFNHYNRAFARDLSFLAEWLEVFPMAGSIGTNPSSPDFVAPTLDGEIDLWYATALFRIYLAHYMGLNLDMFLNGAYDEWHSSMMDLLEGNPETGFVRSPLRDIENAIAVSPPTADGRSRVVVYTINEFGDFEFDYIYIQEPELPAATPETLRWAEIWSIVNDPLHTLNPMNALYVNDVFVDRTHTFERLDRRIYSTLGYESFEVFMAYLLNDFGGLLFLYEVTNAGRAGLTIPMILRASLNNHMKHSWQLIYSRAIIVGEG